MKKYLSSPKGKATANKTRRNHYKKNGVALKERAYNLKRQYGLSLEEYAFMLQKQNGLCYICKQPPKGVHQSGTPFSLHVDHDHITGKVRSLLCTSCNTSLGHYEKKKDLFEKYLGDMYPHDL
ncbi:MAG: endonuclease VII domain-containing protein [archaeon]|nr:endonuclease VII domain-containing protein [archaeon]